MTLSDEEQEIIGQIQAAVATLNTWLYRARALNIGAEVEVIQQDHVLDRSKPKATSVRVRLDKQL
jgi:hypothetical protein